MWLQQGRQAFGGLRPFAAEVAQHTALEEDNFVKRLRTLDAPRAGTAMTALAAVAALRESEGLSPVTPEIPGGPRHALGRTLWAVHALYSGNASEAAEVAGFDNSYLRVAFRRGAVSKPFLWALAAATPGLSAGWLLNGEGEGPPLIPSEIRLRMRVATTPKASDVDEPGPAKRYLGFTYRSIRDTARARRIKQDRGYKCEICGAITEFMDGRRYAEAHHVRPLGGGHEGPDVEDNILCVCPTCHVKLDYFELHLNPADVPQVSRQYVEYHNARHRDKKGMVNLAIRLKDKGV